MKNLTKDELFVLFNSKEVNRYKKNGEFIYRAAKVGETILTIVSGKLETRKIAGEKDIVIRNIQIGSSAETYIISEKTFIDRYEVDFGITLRIDEIDWQMAKAKGLIDAFQYQGETISFQAPWNEEMICENGDIGRAVGKSPNDIYRIEKDTFLQTYSIQS